MPKIPICPNVDLSKRFLEREGRIESGRFFVSWKWKKSSSILAPPSSSVERLSFFLRVKKGERLFFFSRKIVERPSVFNNFTSKSGQQVVYKTWVKPEMSLHDRNTAHSSSKLEAAWTKHVKHGWQSEECLFRNFLWHWDWGRKFLKHKWTENLMITEFPNTISSGKIL